MKYLKAIFNEIRFNLIQSMWRPVEHQDKSTFVQKLINKLWAPSAAINLTGNNSARNLTDESLAYDLPFLLAEESGIHELDFSRNHLGEKTVSVLDEKLFRTEIQSLNLSHNPLNESARNLLPHLIRCLKKINLSNCNLSEKNITDLLCALNKNPNIIELDVSGNQATQSQLKEIDKLLKRNRIYNIFESEYRKKDVLDLERYPLNAQGIKDLAFYISTNAPFLFFESARISEIKAPVLVGKFTNAEFEPLIEALKKNNRITALTMDFRALSPEIEQKIRTQLMLNKARKKMRPNPGFLYYITTGLIVASVLALLVPALSFEFVFLGAIATHLSYNSYFYAQLQKAKSADFSKPENSQAIERGANSTNSWLSYLNPKTYTPMAYLGYMIEKEKLSDKYDVRTPCFKPKLK